MIVLAYQQRPDLIEGMPSWAETAKYDVNATLERNNAPEQGTTENRKLVLGAFQNLLEERFHLRFHREKQLRPGFRLLIARGGLKVKPLVDPPKGSMYTGKRVNGERVIEYRNYTMRRLAAALSGQLGRYVADMTGAEGSYNFKIQAMPDETNSPLVDRLGTFGLRLEAAKLELDIFVIDRLEKLSGN